jgi:hypothetical protein
MLIARCVVLGYLLIGAALLLADVRYFGRSGQWASWYEEVGTYAICVIFWPIVYPILALLYLWDAKQYRNGVKKHMRRKGGSL